MSWSIALIAVPFLSAALAAKIKDRRTQSVLAIAVVAVVLLGAAMNIQVVGTGLVRTWGFGSFAVIQPLLRLDSLSALFSLFCAFVWLAAGFYMFVYMQHEEQPAPFYVNYLLTLGATQGIFLAGNFIVLLVFFEVMSKTSGSWVSFYKTTEAEHAGDLYHKLSLAAAVFMALAVILLVVAGVNPQVGTAALNSSAGLPFSLAVFFLIVAFGTKAGMFPLHIWLPKAHPVAPTPASALLSGILIKTGAYGLIRTGQLANWGQSGLVPWAGILLVVLGSITMLLGVCLALLQGHAKRLLAYHSVSQMGYIILGIGAALFLGEHGTLGIAGAAFHSLNHALFKSALFFGVGMIILATGEADLYKLGGLWKEFPLTGLMMLIAAFGITGVPGLNGYASKTILHHAILEAAHTGHPIMVWAERIFTVVGVGTAASFVKLIGLTFFGRQKTPVNSHGGENKLVLLAMLMLSVAMLFIGTMPGRALTLFISPAAQAGGAGDLGALGHLHFFEWPGVRDMLLTLLAGFVFFAVGMKTHLFHLHFPEWLSIEWLARAAVQKVRGR